MESSQIKYSIYLYSHDGLSQIKSPSYIWEADSMVAHEIYLSRERQLTYIWKLLPSAQKRERIH